MNPKDILAEYYDRGSKTFEVLVAHGEQVMGKAFKAAGQVADLKPDLNFTVLFFCFTMKAALIKY